MADMREALHGLEIPRFLLLYAGSWSELNVLTRFSAIRKCVPDLPNPALRYPVTVIRTMAATPRGELTLLFAASCAVVIILVAAIAIGGSSWMTGAHIRLVLLTCFATALAVAGAILLGVPQLVFRADQRRVDEMRRLQDALSTSDAIVHSEPQVVVLWEHGKPVRLAVQSLIGIAGLPSDQAQLQRFGAWLDKPSADELKSSLEGLFTMGRPFNIIVRTIEGAHLEADGRAFGARAMLRLRGITGHRRDLARVLDQQRDLTREISAGRTLLDSLPMPTWFADDQGRITWANRAYVKAVGADTASDVVHLPVELLEARKRDKAKAALSKDARYTERMPLVIDGHMHAHDVSIVAFDQASAGVALDVEALENAKVDAARRTAAYDRTLHRVATGVAIYGRDQRLAFFNDAYRGIWELDADWLSGNPTIEESLDRLRGLSRLPQVPNYREWKLKVLTAFRSGDQYEDWWHLLDGRTIHVTAELRPDGGVTYLFDDVTQRLALESRFNAMIDVQRETLDSLKEGVAVFAPDGRVQLHNKAFAQIWRLSRKMLSEGPHIDEVTGQCRVLYDDDTMWQQMVHTVTGISDRRAGIEGQLTRADGSVIAYAASPLPDGATLITFADVTDARRAERALIERNEALIAADRMKSQFVGLVSYQMRSPLTNIIGYTEFLQGPHVGPLNGKQREYLGDIEGSSKTLLALIDDIIDLATIDAGGLELKMTPVTARSVIEGAVTDVRERANRARIGFDVRISPDLDVFVADEVRIQQVLYNLLSNAVGFSKHGDTIQVAAWRERGMVALAVEDQGVGVPLEQQSKVFERFESKTLGSKHRGAGLGLSIVKSLVELHGGNVTFVSEPGRGTRVTIRLPEAGIGLTEQRAA
jgi:signal transduction histidine kinase